MKKILLTAAVAVAMLSSCKKVRSCECKYKDATGKVINTNTTAGVETKAKYKKLCETMQANQTSDAIADASAGGYTVTGTVTCEVK